MGESKKKFDIYEMVTRKIIEKLEAGTVPWQNPMQGSRPVNWNTQKPYRGINTLLLNPGEYASFNQIKKAGGKVKKGEKSQTAIFWKMWNTKDKETGEDTEIPIMRYYNVFEVNTQTDGLDSRREKTEYEHDPISKAEKIRADYIGGPSYSFEPVGAWYRPNQDLVNVPPLKDFKSVDMFYSVLFHEMVHSTGHSTRLNRDGVTGIIEFGSATYSKEELVAEIGASMLCGITGILNNTVDNSASYINNWLSVLRGDKKFVVSAAQQAQKACDKILGSDFNRASQDQ